MKLYKYEVRRGDRRERDTQTHRRSDMGKATSVRRTGDGASKLDSRKAIMRQPKARRDALAKARILVPRNIRGVQQEAGVARSARGVGTAIYDNDIALPMAYVVQLACEMTQKYLKRRTVKVEVMEAAYRVAILGEPFAMVLEELKKGGKQPRPEESDKAEDE